MTDTFREDMINLIPKLRAYATVVTGSVSAADDLVQDVLVRAWRYRAGFIPGSNLKAWMFRILRNEFLSQVRHRVPTVAVDGIYSDFMSCKPEQEWRQRYSELLGALSQLTDANREALLLVAAGLSYEQAAEACGCAVGTIKSRVCRSRQRLAEIIDYDLPTLRQPRLEASHACA
jgi:RNA polymerase sigma-70 factor, ECF subfamily